MPDEAPTTSLVRVYRYGLLPPTAGAERVDEQIYLAHRYQNTLIEIERRRREAIAVVQRSHDTTAPIVAREAALVAELDAQRASIAATGRGGEVEEGHHA